MPAKKENLKKVEVKEEVKKDEKVMTTKKDKKEVIYWNTKKENRNIEVVCTASRWQLKKWVRYYVTKEVLENTKNNLEKVK